MYNDTSHTAHPTLTLAQATPAELHPISIAVVNSIGDLGGFAGPYLLGYFHDRFGPACPADAAHAAANTTLAAALDSVATDAARNGTATECVAQFGWGTVLLAAFTLALALALAAWGWRLLGLAGSHHRSPPARGDRAP